jgi:lysozyme family protein
LEEKMAYFNIAVQLTLKNEGGYTNDPNDEGGETNFGISAAQFPGLDIKNLTEAQATEFYKDRYWKDYYSQIDDQSIANKLFDMGVLFGVGTAVNILQKALKVTFPDIVVDGGFGPETLSYVNQSEPVSLLSVYKSAMISRVLQIANADPNDRSFVAGWGRRVNS